MSAVEGVVDPGWSETAPGYEIGRIGLEASARVLRENIMDIEAGIVVRDRVGGDRDAACGSIRQAGVGGGE